MTVNTMPRQEVQEHATTSHEIQIQSIQDLRARIANTDQEIIALIAHRLELVRTLGAEKTRHGLTAADPAREAVVLRTAAASARAAGLDEERVREMFWCVIKMSRSVQLREHGR
ncbi:MAG: chorismate mutase [Longimicrobiales bacterium]